MLNVEVPMPDLKTPLLYLLAFALFGALAVAGVERTRRAAADVRTAAVKQEFAEYRATQAESGRHADRAERQQERDREDASRKHAEAARSQMADASTAAADAAAAGRKLRNALDIAARALRACPSASPSGGGKAADATADLLADVRRRLDEATDGTIRFADQSHIAGRTCERIHDGVSRVHTPAPP